MDHDIRNRFLLALREQIDSQSLFCPNDRWLLAVSGGPDSMAMLYGLLSLQRQSDWPGPNYLHIAHLNHKLRGTESDADGEFVRTRAEQLGLDCTIGDARVAEIAKDTGQSLELAARTERYKFLARTALRNQCNKIALAHNADDQAETILHRILRGTGVRGLAGILSQRKLEEYDTADSPLTLIRPLLKIRTTDIIGYLESESIAYRIDHTNLSRIHTRNRIRHELLPLLETSFNPGIRQALTRLGQTAAWMSELLCQDAKTELQELTISRTKHSLCLDLPGLQRRTAIQQTELIHQAMRELSVGLQPIGFRHISAILELIDRRDDTTRPLDLPSRLKVTRGTTKLIIENMVTPKKEEDWPCLEIPLPIDTSVPVEGAAVAYLDNNVFDILILRTETIQPPDMAGPLKNTGGSQEKVNGYVERIDPKSVQGALRLRTWREGDRFEALGTGGEKTLGDFFTDAKVPVEHRKRIGLVCDAVGIVWVIGMRIADRVKITSDTREILTLAVKY